MPKKSKLDQAALVESILSRAGFDGSGAVLDGQGGIERLTRRPAPILMAAFAIHDDWPDRRRSRSHVKADVLRFELLSLAARLAMAGDKEARRLAKDLKVDIDAFPRIQASVIEAAIAEVARRLEAEPSNGEWDEPGARHRARGGLVLRGLRIAGPLNLYNGEIPFPIRLTGCVIEDAIVADHCRTRSLDLSGSAIRGLSATFLQAEGNLRMRRTVSLGPIDLGGATIGGVLDLSDAVVFPFDAPPEGSAFTGDRGSLNLSLASVENELRFNRARIYGGLTMKGATIHRSMFLEDARILSPIATVAMMATRWLHDGEGRPCEGRYFDPTAVPELAGLLALEKTLPHVADIMHPDKDLCDAPARRAAEKHGVPSRAQDPKHHALLFRLLAESTRARTTAIRADGIKVHGSIFARRLDSRGRLRARYALIKGSLNLRGSRLRSPRDSFEVMHILGQAREPRIQMLWKMANDSRQESQKRERGEGDSFALDIRDSHIEGAVDLSPMPTTDESGDAINMRTTTVHGSVVANQATIGAGFDLTAVHFEWCTRYERPPSFEASHVHVGCDLTLLRATGVVGLQTSYARVDGSIYLHGPLQKVTELGKHDTDRAVARCDIAGDLQMRSMVIGGDADLLFGAKPQPGLPPLVLNLRYSIVGGGLSIYPTLHQEANDETGTIKVHPTAEQFNDTLRDIGLERDNPDTLRRAGRRFGGVVRRYRMPSPKPSGTGEPPDEYIDLRNVQTKVLRHPPSAWPVRNGLLITQLKYETSGTSGPLGIAVEMRHGSDENRLTMARYWRRSILMASTGLVGCLGLISAELAHDPLTESWFVIPFLGWWINLDAVGRVNLGFLWLLTWIVAAFTNARVNMRPNESELKPMGVFWLTLQRHRLNPFRTRGYYLPTEPYLVAANALRADGKLRSAELVELARARVRRRTLSLRHHFLASNGLQFLDYIAQYGINISRTVLAGMFMILVFAGLFELEHKLDYFRPSVAMTEPSAFRSLTFAADTVIPVGGEISRQWRLVIPEQPDRPVWRPASMLDKAWREFCRSSIWLARIVGLLLTAIIGASLAARAESFLSRMQQ